MSCSSARFSVVEVRLRAPLQLLCVLACAARFVAQIAEILDDQIEAACGALDHPEGSLFASKRAKDRRVVNEDP